MPGIFDGLSAGQAGLRGHGTAISILADNIANQNTTGFKAARADFTDVLAGSLGGGGAASSSTGSGSAVTSITRVQNQGTFETTGRALDIGIDGNGFLIVRNDSNTTFYTRAGNLNVDPEGFLRDQNGLNVIGFPANGSGTLQKMNVNERVQQNISTGNLSLSGNLDASSAVSTAVPATPSFQQLSAAAKFQYSSKVYDSLGAPHDITTYFFNDGIVAGVSTWRARTFANAGDVGGVAGDAFELTPSITLQFSNSGALTSTGIGTITPAWSSGAASGSIELDFSGFTQFSSPSTVTANSQDGTGSGSVTGFSISKDGTLLARLDNGQSAAIGTIALATFSNNEGLQRIGNSLFSESTASGEAVVGTPGVGTFGSLQSGSLELSTSDLAADFIKLISLQRGFQGSSRIVSSINDLLNEVVNLGR